MPIYVHAKVCIVDDVWFTCGSDNFNRRSWTNDSEVTCAVIDATLDDREPADLSGAGDGARVLARDLRLQLWAEHLGLDPRRPAPARPERAWDLWVRVRARARRLARRGPAGPRPAGRVRHHEPEPVRSGDPAVGRARVPDLLRPRRPAAPVASPAQVLNQGRRPTAGQRLFR